MATDQQVLAAHRDLVDALAERTRRRAEADRLIEALRSAERLHQEASERVNAAQGRLNQFAVQNADVHRTPESKVETKPAPVPVDDNKAKPNLASELGGANRTSGQIIPPKAKAKA